MWFKNLMSYSINEEFELDIDELAERLKEKPARPCASQELSTYGFVPPINSADENAPLMLVASGYALICAQQENRLLPPSVVNDAVDERVKDIESKQKRIVYKKERSQLKDEVIQELLPRAFTKKKRVFAAIDIAMKRIYINTSSSKDAENLLSTIRDVLGSFPVVPTSAEADITVAMTRWVKSETVGNGFFLRDRATMEDFTEARGRVSVVNEDLASEQIQNHLGTGKRVSQLAMAWEDKVSFVLDKAMTIKNLRFEELLQAQAEEDAGNSDDVMSASLVLMMGTIREMMPKLIQVIEGEE